MSASRPLALAAACLALFTCLPQNASAAAPSAADTAQHGPTRQPWTAEQSALFDLSRRIPLILAQDGWQPYAALFHADYTNWQMGTPLRNRAQFLQDVRRWFEGGNRAVGSELVPVSADIIGDLALLRFQQTETFVDAKGGQSRFSGQFTSVMKRTGGQWQFYATTFSASPAS